MSFSTSFSSNWDFCWRHSKFESDIPIGLVLMVMMLPFLTALISAWYCWRGGRRAAMSWWAVTAAIYVAWCFYHMTDPLKISL